MQSTCLLYLRFLPADRIIFSFFIKIKYEMHVGISFWALQVRLSFIPYPNTRSCLAFYSFQHPCFSYAYFIDILFPDFTTLYTVSGQDCAFSRCKHLGLLPKCLS
jgi:hypothetical protein